MMVKKIKVFFSDPALVIWSSNMEKLCLRLTGRQKILLNEGNIKTSILLILLNCMLF